MVLDMLVAGGASAVSQIATFCQFVCTTALSAQAIRQSANVPVLCPALHGGCDDNRWLTCTDFNVFLPVESLYSEADKPTVVDTHHGASCAGKDWRRGVCTRQPCHILQQSCCDQGNEAH